MQVGGVRQSSRIQSALKHSNRFRFAALQRNLAIMVHEYQYQCRAASCGHASPGRSTVVYTVDPALSAVPDRRREPREVENGNSALFSSPPLIRGRRGKVDGLLMDRSCCRRRSTKERCHATQQPLQVGELLYLGKACGFSEAEMVKVSEAAERPTDGECLRLPLSSSLFMSFESVPCLCIPSSGCCQSVSAPASPAKKKVSVPACCRSVSVCSRSGSVLQLS
jgi:hypothetical protein